MIIRPLEVIDAERFLDIFKRYQTTQEATLAMIEKLIKIYNRGGSISGYTFTSIVSELLPNLMKGFQ